MGLLKKEQRKENQFLIVGLGNPTKQYDGTKHNVGFVVIDELAKKYNISVSKIKGKAFIGSGSIKDKKVILAKPQTYMNLSGESIRELVNFYKIPQENFIVIYDDISLQPSRIRIRKKGSHGGHNGIKNIINIMGTDEFPRIKVGVGEKPSGWDLADYVLSKFSEDDLPLINMGIDKSIEGVEIFLEDNLDTAMNKMNPSEKPPKKKKSKLPLKEDNKEKEEDKKIED